MMRPGLRFTCLVLTGASPLITLLLYLIAPFTMEWRTAILSPLMVVAMVYGLIPMIQTYFARFIATE